MTAQSIRAHAKITIILCYAFPNDHEHSAKDQFYQYLQDLVNDTPPHDIIILNGDITAHIGGDKSGFELVLGPHAYGKHTNNGDHFIQFFAMNNLKIGQLCSKIRTSTKSSGSPMIIRLLPKLITWL